MRLVPMLCALVVVSVSLTADAGYARVAKRGSFGAFVTRVARAARRHDQRAMRRLVGRDFTVGEELGRESSLEELPGMWSSLLAVTDHGACYRTGRNLVQCETPDPGAALDHTKFARSTIAIFERTARGWQLDAFYE